MHKFADLFTPGCVLTGAHLRFSHDLAAFERNLRATIAPPTLVDFAPLFAGPFRQRSTGWGVGSVGVTLGEQSAIRLVTARSDVVRLCMPVRGGSRYRQAGRRAVSDAGRSWVYLADQGVHLDTTDDHAGAAFALLKPRLHQTVQAMEADPGSAAADEVREISLDGASARRAERMLPALLSHLHGAQALGPEAIHHAEDAAYRFVAQLMAPTAGHRRDVLTRQRTRQTVDAACSFMMSNLEHLPTLTRIEAEVGVSARALQSAFAAHLQTSPGAWFRQQRLQVARHLLRTHRVESVAEAALACGFHHTGRFSREFRAMFGLSPNELLRSAGTV